MLLSIIVAASENNVIGINNQLPWKLSADLKFFKNTTWGSPIIMGRKTYESIGRPLPGRQNIVITRQANYQPEGVQVVGSIEAAIATAQAWDVQEAFITGGTEIFLQAFPFVNRVYLTRVKAHIEGDAYFPALPASEWQLISNELHHADEKNEYDYDFQKWERILKD
ncbi:dihydrofolate reductase [Chitinophaga skermanii]|uniref:Dihydrofolate reductase n=1 Tax=Chitinophaga skermanii TaxID=331697 RepID=A0A327QL57_9BACT|nr:dihydrofolate reductase [Chitinophaga skermanii]RAJ05051.1 dihydrofolate reductase [Chitinophaga skermanii]